MDKGFIQVYTGNGKGKTTAAGLSLRAVCAGKKVFLLNLSKEGNTVSWMLGIILRDYRLNNMGEAASLKNQLMRI